MQLLLLVLASACSRGSFGGEVTKPDTAAPERGAAAGKGAPPPVKHEHVVFHWTSGDDSVSGKIRTQLPDGETFSGNYHEITRTAAVSEYGDVYNDWYAAPWAGPTWYWGGAWPYYGSIDEFVTSYSGKVVATLEGDRGTRMRCHFDLSDPDSGLKGGGSGECQLSNGERITAHFEPS